MPKNTRVALEKIASFCVNQPVFCSNKKVTIPRKPYLAGKIAEKAVRRSVFLTIWHCILYADSTKTHSSSVTY